MRLSLAALRLALALIVALTSVHTAVARATAGPVTWGEICEGAVTVAVAFDAKGNPVTPHPTCPDCVIAAGLLPIPVGLAPTQVKLTALAWADAVTQRRGPVRLTPVARGPPAQG